MSCNVATNCLSPHMAQHQMSLLVPDGIESPQENAKNPRRGPTKKIASEASSSVGILQLDDRLERIEIQLLSLQEVLKEIHERTLRASAVKEYYTTQEVAQILKKRPYTVREWCRLGRVHGEKSHSGRGLDEEWRISHAELTRIQNEGLLPQPSATTINQPRRFK